MNDENSTLQRRLSDTERVKNETLIDLRLKDQTILELKTVSSLFPITRRVCYTDDPYRALINVSVPILLRCLTFQEQPSGVQLEESPQQSLKVDRGKESSQRQTPSSDFNISVWRTFVNPVVFCVYDLFCFVCLLLNVSIDLLTKQQFIQDWRLTLSEQRIPAEQVLEAKLKEIESLTAGNSHILHPPNAPLALEII